MRPSKLQPNPHARLKASAPLRLDHVALRRALGGRPEVVEVPDSGRGQAKASG